MNPSLSLSDFDYFLPAELIAQTPAARRRDSRLLHLDADSALHDRNFSELPSLLRRGDLLIFNDTRVIKARLHGHKTTGGKVEVLIDRLTGPDRALAQIRASKSPKPGSTLLVNGQFPVAVLNRADDLFELRFPEPVLVFLEQHGSTPLPPYIHHSAMPSDDERYQTVYAQHPGAVAAPTAGLHFDPAMLHELSEQGIDHAFVTLHVGAGTFQPLRVENLADHRMHAEHFIVADSVLAKIAQARRTGGRSVAVGTTSVRALESVAHQSIPQGGLEGDTRLFITPGYQFSYVDALITNFHLPRSTLLMLVSALAGIEPIHRAYAHAVRERYRFFSYGDAMFIESPTP